MARKNKNNQSEEAKPNNDGDGNGGKKRKTQRKLTTEERSDLVKVIAKGDEEKAKELIRIMKNVNSVISECGDIALTYSCLYGRTEIVKLLIELGADINLIDKSQYSPLITATQRGNVELVQLLIDAGADINFVSKDGESALARASFFNRFEVFEFLISCGVDLGRCGRKALVYASLHENIDAVKKLIELGMNINSKNSSGLTALHRACKKNNLTFVELLMNNGADENIKDKEGKTPIEMEGTSEEIKEFIKNYNSTSYVLK